MKTTETSREQLEAWLEPIVKIGRRAGERILEIYETDFAVEQKEDRTPLTKADLASHTTILQSLTELTPDIPILSEESTEIPFSERSNWHRYWLVDPLDGTKEFVKRNGEFTVNIALIEGDRAVVGLVHAPVIGVTYYAARGTGAFRISGDGDPAPIKVRKPASDPVVVAGSRSHAGDRLQEYLAALGDYELVSMGSSLKSCLVAEGKADLYVRLGLTSEWDTASAQCVVEEAGGRVTRTDLSQLLYNTKDSLLNPEFFVFGDDSRDWSQYLPED